mgnify:CR=1 FL=1
MVIDNRQRDETAYHRLTGQRLDEIIIVFRETGRLSLLGNGLPN